MEENKRLEVFVGDYIDFVLSTSIDIFKQESQQIQKNQTKNGESLEKVEVEKNADKDEKMEFTEEETADEEERIQFFKQIREAEYQKLMKTKEMQRSWEDKVEPANYTTEADILKKVEVSKPKLSQDEGVVLHKTSAGTDVHFQGILSQGEDIQHSDSNRGVVQPVQTTREQKDSGQPSLLRRMIQRITKVFRRKSGRVADVSGARADITLIEYDLEIMEEIRRRKTRFGMLTKCFGR